MDILDNLLVKDDVIQIIQLSVILILSTFLFLCVWKKNLHRSSSLLQYS